MITIYHNARCSKSREGLQILKNSGQEYQVKEYLKEPLSEKELRDLLDKLGMAPMEIIRTDENIWKEIYKDRDVDDEELIRAMVAHPALIQRPIVVKDDSAVVGRPPSRINELLR